MAERGNDWLTRNEAITEKVTARVQQHDRAGRVVRLEGVITNGPGYTEHKNFTVTVTDALRLARDILDAVYTDSQVGED